MSVITTVTLPAQPTIGQSVYTPLGGNGYSAPHGCYMVESSVVGDASGGTGTVQIQGDARYVNLFAFINAKIAADAAAGDFQLSLEQTSGSAEPNVHVVGTIPQVATTFSLNAAFLWYPPPIYFKGQGIATAAFPNVGVGETYRMAVQVYLFRIDVLQATPLPILQWNVPGVSAPAAV